MKEETRGLFFAIILSMIAIFITNWLFPTPSTENTSIEAPVETTPIAEETAETSLSTEKATLPTATAIAQDSRISISNHDIKGSIRLKGARFDDIKLRKYHVDLA